MPNIKEYHDLLAATKLQFKRDPAERLAEIKGPAFTEYRRKWDAANLYQYEPNFPIHINFETYFGCILKCVMCPHSLSPEERKIWGTPEKKLGTALIQDILDQGKGTDLSAINFGGINEPLVHADLFKLIDYAASIGILDIFLCTNGLLLDQQTADNILRSPITRLEISLDSLDRDAYQSIRRGSNFDTVMANIEYFLRKKEERGNVLPLVRISAVKLPVNHGSMREFAAYWQDRVDYVAVQKCKFFQDEQKFTMPDGSTRVYSRKSAPPDPAFRCSQSWQVATLRSNGDVSPCCGWDGMHIKMGNIHADSLAAIWNCAPYKKFRLDHSTGHFTNYTHCIKCAQGIIDFDDCDQDDGPDGIGCDAQF